MKASRRSRVITARRPSMRCSSTPRGSSLSSHAIRPRRIAGFRLVQFDHLARFRRWCNGPPPPWWEDWRPGWSSPRMMVSKHGVGRPAPHHQETTMDHYAGIDVSLEYSSVCVVDATGKIVREGKVLSEPAALIAWFGSLGLSLVRIGLEAGPLSQWLYAGLRGANIAVELLETRHVRNALKTMPVKTDRKDARGIAELMRLGWQRPVHCKSMAAQETRAMLTTRDLVQSKLHDVEMSLRGTLRGFGLKVGKTTPRRFEARIMELVAGHPSLEVIAKALLAVRAVLLREFNAFQKQVRAMARSDTRAR